MRSCISDFGPIQKIICFFIAALLFYAHSYSQNYFVESADSIISVKPDNKSSQTTIPKAPSRIPLSASFNRSICSVQLSFLNNLGVIEVEILNTSTGYIETGSINSAYLSAIIPLSGGPGHYIIYFYLPSNKKYFCELEV